MATIATLPDPSVITKAGWSASKRQSSLQKKKIKKKSYSKKDSTEVFGNIEF